MWQQDPLQTSSSGKEPPRISWVYEPDVLLPTLLMGNGTLYLQTSFQLSIHQC